MGFYQFWAWQPSWSCDNKSFVLTFVPPIHRGSTGNLATVSVDYLKADMEGYLMII